MVYNNQILKNIIAKEKHDGAMLAIMLPKEISKSIKNSGIFDNNSISSDGLHITLVYLGKAKDINKESLKLISKVAEKICAKHNPLEILITGIGKFAGNNDKGMPFYLVPNAKGLNQLQSELESVISCIVDLPSDFAWVPHITVGYHKEDIPLSKISNFPKFKINEIRFQVGGKKFSDIPIGKPIRKNNTLSFDRILKIASNLYSAGDTDGLERLCRQFDFYLEKKSNVEAPWRKNFDYDENSPWHGSLQEFKKRFPGGLKEFLEWKNNKNKISNEAMTDINLLLKAFNLLDISWKKKGHYIPTSHNDVEKFKNEPKLWSLMDKFKDIEEFLNKYKKYYSADDNMIALNTAKDFIKYWAQLVKGNKNDK